METLMHLVFNLCLTYIVSKVVSVTTGHLLVSLLSTGIAEDCTYWRFEQICEMSEKGKKINKTFLS